MTENFKQVLQKTKNNPYYLWYYWQNHHYLRWHFPFIYKLLTFYKTPKELHLGSPIELKKLHVILRTTDYVMNINSSRQLENIGIVTRNDVIRVGGCSLFKAAKLFAEKYGKDNIRITLVVDRLSDAGMSQYQEAADSVGLSFDIVYAMKHGNGPTFQTQISIALQDSDDTLALILEDDYLLNDKVFTTCFHIMQNNSNVIGMNPHFHPDRVRRQDIGKLTVIDNNLYSRIYSTCCTFFMPVQQMRHYTKQLLVYDGWENGSINSIWKKGICLSPLGWTLAEHLHRSDLSPVTVLLDVREDKP